MKSVLISIQPKWCELIASGIKTVEVRKTKPKIETPFKCYIYQTKHGNGKVIGEFVCDSIEAYQYDEHIGFPTPQYEGDPSFCDCGAGYWITCAELYETCLTHEALMCYGNGNTLYGWHISDLVIYDKPKDLSEFKKICDGNCQSCKYAVWQTYGVAYEPYIVDCLPTTSPPQSWCYVEERT